MKKILLIGSILFTMVACQSETTSDSSSDNSESEPSSKKEEQTNTGDIYAQDWQTFKEAVISKDKKSVLFFALKNDQSLRDVLEMSYDYIFDDVMIENIKKMKYQDLPTSSQDPDWKELSTYYYGEEDGEVFESGTFLYFEERPEGLRIVNFLAAG